MITITPEDGKSLFDAHGLSFREDSGCVIAKDGDKLLSYCLYDLGEKYLTVRYLQSDELTVADGVLRAVLNMAVQRGITDAKYDDSAPAELLEQLHFVGDSSKKTLDLDKLFKGCP